MRFLITIIYLLLITFVACAMGSKHPVERKPQDKMWRPCQDFEVIKPIGKFCNRVCTERKGKKCKVWKTNIKDFTNRDDFMFFRNGSFVLIDEDQVL